MADYNSSLPIRTEGDATEKVQVRILDKTVDANQLAVNADGSVNITDNGGSLTVDAVNLDIRDLAFATDKVDVSGSTGLSATVTATDLDIRDLAFATEAKLKEESITQTYCPPLTTSKALVGNLIVSITFFVEVSMTLIEASS
jgi:hypothetical protein